MYLNCHTYFSFKYGTLSVENLFREAQRNQVQKLVLTDINNTSGYIELLRLCRQYKKEYPLEVALGIEFRHEDQLLYIAIARNNQGFEEINAFLSYHNNTDRPLPRRAPEFDHAYVIYPWGNYDPNVLREHEFVGVKVHQINRIMTSPFHTRQDKLVGLHPVTFKDKACYNVHRLLRAIDQNTLLSKLPPHQQANMNEVMLPEDLLAGYYRRYPQVVANTQKILNDCSIDFTLGTDKNKQSLTGSKANDWEFLRSKAWEGFNIRYNANDPDLVERFNRELNIIRTKDFAAYYLITYDLINFAKKSNFDFVGRGSGANSLIAYCLGITNVDPIDLDLYFERFLNPERSSPPDFDVDFSWKDRDVVTQYLFDKYGHKHTALLGTHTTYQDRSILRELGKVFGLPKSEIDTIVTYPQQARNRDHITKLIFRYAERMRKMPANLSIHAGGVLITEKPIYAYTATDLPPKGFPVSHFEMHNAEDMGLYKFDVLSQRGLGHIKEALSLIRQNQGRKEDINRFTAFKEDPKIKKLLRTGHTMGCFYVESPAMRMLLDKLSCDDYLTLVAASSIIRPGVARSGMMRAYIERHHAVKEGGTYEAIHPKMDELMYNTYGVMVYQEDVIKVAHHFAGLTLTEADVLRRGMSGKFRSRQEFRKVREQFFRNCYEKEYPKAVTDRVWYEIESFSGYSFAKGHSASYAVESYQSLYLKAHYPLEFMVAVINNFGGFYKTEFYFHEARMNGAIIEAPCVNHSTYLTSITGRSIYIGFVHLKSLETRIGEMIPRERRVNGPFKNLDNFMRRIPLGLEQIRVLIRIGAFRFTGKTKQQLLWEAMLYFGQSEASREVTHLFEMETTPFVLPELERSPYEDAFDEMELLGFPLCDPFELVNPEGPHTMVADGLITRLGQSVTMLGYVITTKNTRTKDGKPMHFGTFYDREGNVFDSVHFPQIAKKYPFRGKGFYLMHGKVVEDFGVPMIEVSYMDKVPMIDRYTTKKPAVMEAVA